MTHATKEEEYRRKLQKAQELIKELSEFIAREIHLENQQYYQWMNKIFELASDMKLLKGRTMGFMERYIREERGT